MGKRNKKQGGELRQLRTAKEFLNYAERHGARLEPGKGSHIKVYGPRGQTVVPNHPGDLGKGLRIKLRKEFLAIGLAVIAFIVALIMMLPVMILLVRF